MTVKQFGNVWTSFLKACQRVKHRKKNSGANMKCSKIVSELEWYRTTFNGLFLPMIWSHGIQTNSSRDLLLVELWVNSNPWGFRHFLWNILDDWAFAPTVCLTCGVVVFVVGLVWTILNHVSSCWWIIHSCSFMMYIQVASQTWDNSWTCCSSNFVSLCPAPCLRGQAGQFLL